LDTREVNSVIETAAEKIKDIQAGTILPHLVVAEMLGVDYKGNKYNSMSAKLRNYLRSKYSIFLNTEYKVGYRILFPWEQIDQCEGTCIKGIKTVTKGVKHMNDIRMENIPEDKRPITIGKANKYGNLLGMLKVGAQAELKQIAQ
jgi:hypothetical protein